MPQDERLIMVPAIPAALDKATQRTEMRPVLARLSLAFDPDLVPPFRIADAGLAGLAGLIVGPAAGEAEAPLALSLRLAAETALWGGRLPETPVYRFVAAWLAARSAAVACSMMSKAERADCSALFTPEQLDLLCRDHPPSALSAALNGLCAGEDGDRIEALRSDALRQGWRVAPPVEALLTTGGDERLRFDPETSLNRYGCSPRPRPNAITFASTTATSISDGAFAHVEALRRRLGNAAALGRLESEYAAAMAEVRTALQSQYGVAGTEVILTPSGTDAEFYALHLALAADDRPLLNIVIAPQESASNVMPAAAGRHYNATTAMGHKVAVGEPVDAATTARVELATLDVRDSDGEPLPSSAIEAAADSRIAAALASGRRALLHVLDTSKTGLAGPSFASACALADRYGENLDVVIDASQLRLTRESVASYLNRGFMVIVTGSKFFTGPPFAGALLVPSAVGARVRSGCCALPQGYDAYSEPHCWPESWEHSCRPKGGDANFGLLMRWWAALWEMAAFHAQPAADARRILSTFLKAVRAAIERTPTLRLLPCPPPARENPDGWDALATILTVALTPEGRERPLRLVEARRVYGWLNSDVAALLPEAATDEERGLAKLMAHIGQPVVISGSEQDGLCGLRLAAGARLVSGSLLDVEIADAKLILAKLDVLLRYRAHLLQVQA